MSGGSFNSLVSRVLVFLKCDKNKGISYLLFNWTTTIAHTIRIEETTSHTHFPKIIILHIYFLFYLSTYYFFLYLFMVNRLYIVLNRLYTMINNLFTIINNFYVVVSKLYTIINKLFSKKIFLLIV